MTTTKDEPTVYAQVSVDCIGPGFTDDPGDPKTGKPYLRLTFPDGVVIAVTAHLAEMVGGAGRGATARWQDIWRARGAHSESN